MPAADVKVKLDNLVLALGADNTYAYSLRPPFSDGNAVATLPIAIPQGSNLHWAALGPKAGSFYLCFKGVADGSFQCLWGDGIPEKLRIWLSNARCTRLGDRHTRQKTTKVVLGPSDSFLAWDHESVRWNNLPDKLEETLQSWLTSTGWKYGPPEHATLGCDGAFYVVTSKGATVFLVPKSLKAVWHISNSWASKGSGCSLQRVCLSPCNRDQYIIVDDSRAIRASCPAQKGLIISIADYLYTPKEREIRRQAREEARWRQSGGDSRPESCDKENSQPGRFDQRGEDRKRKSAKAGFGSEWPERERKRSKCNGTMPQDSDNAEKSQPKSPEPTTLHDAVEMWRHHCKELFSKSKPIAFFPMLPTMCCKCTELSCQASKTASALKACKHEVADVLHACEGYSVKWLRKERLKWHPDMFGRKCAPNRREQLSKAAGELFAIIENIIHNQRTRKMS